MSSPRTASWVLFDPGTGGALDTLLVTPTAAGALRTFGFKAKLAPESYGYRGALEAPRWVVLFGVAVTNEVTRRNVQPVADFASRLIRRGLADPDFATALVVTLETGGLAACAAFVPNE